MAKTKDSGDSERLQELITERQRYETWLAAIAIRRDSAPEHVVARVEEDYKGRLARIREELSARAGELRDRINSLSEQLAETKLHEAARRDERAEAELRASVGELSPGQWTEIAEGADSAIAEYESNRKVIERDLTELEQILSSITWSDSPGAPAAAVPADATRTARPAPPTPAAGAPAPAKPPAPATASSGATSSSAAPPAPPRPAPRPAPVPQRPAPAAAGATAPQNPSPSSVASAPAAEPAPAGRPPASRAPAPETQRRKDASQREGQEKTLLCNECGTANYPTEWYCEACGAELSNM